MSVTVNGIGVPLLFAGPQTQFPGLDQVNIELPSSLKGAGISNIVLTIADEPKPEKPGMGATAASNAGIMAHNIIARSAAMLGVKPDFSHENGATLVSLDE